jgi:leucyl/phenylalanyl-tRNA---protein transferase
LELAKGVSLSKAPTPVGASRWLLPQPSLLPDGDLVAVGGDLEPATIVNAYRHGMFPMRVPEAEGVLCWWSPDPRGILPLDNLRVTRSMRQSARRFDVRVNTCFSLVIAACADPARKKGWITDDFIAAYTTLHALGWAHSIEVFDRSGELAGGLYGVRVDGLFSGESMFFRKRDASKVALMALVDLMKETRMTLLDVQWPTDHLVLLGAIAIPRREYLDRLANALR